MTGRTTAGRSGSATLVRIMDDPLFRAPQGQWQRLHPNYLKVKLISIVVTWIILISAVMVPAVTNLDKHVYLPLGIGLVLILIWRIIRAPRAYRRWGYAETDSDIYVTNGLMYRQMQCVPYGRMQQVDVSSGPLERRFNLGKVTMTTASTSSDVTIPGLRRDVAAALRDRLIERGEELQAGI